MGSRVFMGNKMLQERIDALEDMLAEERALTTRNAMACIHFHNALIEIAKLHPAEHGHPVIAQKVLEDVRKGNL
jgi:hypothetical protein